MQAGTQFTYPVGMEGWVYLVDFIVQPNTNTYDSYLSISCASERLYCFSEGVSLSNWTMQGWILSWSSRLYKNITVNVIIEAI